MTNRRRLLPKPKRKVVIRHRVSPLVTFFENRYFIMGHTLRNRVNIDRMVAWEYEDVDLQGFVEVFEVF